MCLWSRLLPGGDHWGDNGKWEEDRGWRGEPKLVPVFRSSSSTSTMIASSSRLLVAHFFWNAGMQSDVNQTDVSHDRGVTAFQISDLTLTVRLAEWDLTRFRWPVIKHVKLLEKIEKRLKPGKNLTTVCSFIWKFMITCGYKWYIYDVWWHHSSLSHSSVHIRSFRSGMLIKVASKNHNVAKH